MITIKHNFDETKFKWLWAKYVKAGNIDKHCTASLIGTYSKKFSGTSNHHLLSQPIIQMDEVASSEYEAIYFCGVLKAGYLNKNPDKNNYQHNVHFAVRPLKHAKDVWDFENWHVEIEGGVLEHIPATYELNKRFFEPPYTSHYYTCRIFRWMIGHFYPQELIDPLPPFGKKITFNCFATKHFNELTSIEFEERELYSCFLDKGTKIAKQRIEHIDIDDLNEWRSRLIEEFGVENLNVRNVWKEMINRGVCREWVCELIDSQELDGGISEMLTEAMLERFGFAVNDLNELHVDLAIKLIVLGIESYFNTYEPYLPKYRGWQNYLNV